MRANLDIFIFIISIAVYALFWDGAVVFAERFLLFAYIPFVISLACQYVIGAYQNTALQIARISLLQRSGVFDPSNISALHIALIPDKLLAIDIVWRFSSLVGFYSILFFQGWLSALLALVFSIVIFPVICAMSPHLFPNYFYRVLCGISIAVQRNPVKFQQQIEHCSISINDIRASLDELVDSRCNVGILCAQLMNEYKNSQQCDSPND